MMMNESTKEAESYPPVHYLYMAERDFHRRVVSRLAKNQWFLCLVAIEEVHRGFKPAEVNCLLWLAGVQLKRYLEVLNPGQKMVVYCINNGDS
jgi:hypothetical protein